MTELQIILIVCAVVFVASLYWWGKKSKQQPIQRAYRQESWTPEPPEDEFQVTLIKRDSDATPQDLNQSFVSTPNSGSMLLQPADNARLDEPLTASVKHPEQVNLFESANEQATAYLRHAENAQHEFQAVSDRMTAQTAASEQVAMNEQRLAVEQTNTASAEVQVPSQVFALLVLSAGAKFGRKQLHVAMEASRLTFHNDGTYVKHDSTGNIVFRIANVVEPGYFTDVEDASFESPGVALVLELPSVISPYRAMDEFIAVARKVSQNLGAKLYDVNRHQIKESDLKAMREYAQSLTF